MNLFGTKHCLIKELSRSSLSEFNNWCGFSVYKYIRIRQHAEPVQGRPKVGCWAFISCWACLVSSLAMEACYLLLLEFLNMAVFMGRVGSMSSKYLMAQ
jgi:hypothetical protein